MVFVDLSVLVFNPFLCFFGKNVFFLEKRETSERCDRHFDSSHSEISHQTSKFYYVFFFFVLEFVLKRIKDI